MLVVRGLEFGGESNECEQTLAILSIRRFFFAIKKFLCERLRAVHKLLTRGKV